EVMNGEPRQVVEQATETAVPVTDLRQLTNDERPGEVSRLANEEARRPFDLSRGPLLRASLLQTGDHEWMFLLTFHHIVCDGWSLNLFARELTLLYAALATGQQAVLPSLPVQY